jgi:hypothetical protein
MGQPYQLVLEGVVGQGFQGDISVDDIAFNQGPCPASSKFLFLFFFCNPFVLSLRCL